VTDDKTSTALSRAIGTLLIGASVLQRRRREFFAALVPSQFAERKDQIQGVMTGTLAGLGVTFLIPWLRPVARWATTALLVGTLPAAIDQVRNPPPALKEAHIPPALVVARIPAQMLVVLLAWRATRRPSTK